MISGLFDKIIQISFKSGTASVQRFGLYFLTCVTISFSMPYISCGKDYKEYIYTMKFNGLSTATSTLIFNQLDSTTLELSWLLKSKTAYKIFFSVDNRYQSFVNIKTGLPEKLYKNIRQKNIKQSWQTIYNREQLFAGTDNGMQWPIQEGCLDILSLIWSLRSREITPGDTLAYLLDIESHLWKLQGTVSAAKTEYDSPAVPCYRLVEFAFSPSLPIVKRAWKTDLLTNRISREDTKLTICFGATPDNILVYLKFATADNTVEMQLDKNSSQKAP